MSLTPYMAGKAMCLIVNEQHTVNAFSLNFVCSLPLKELHHDILMNANLF
jgi:hypothetical protein